MSTDAASLPDDAALLKQLVAQLLDANAQLERRNAQLEHQLDQLLRRVYGPRSEHVDPNQLTLFAEDAGTMETPSHHSPHAAKLSPCPTFDTSAAGGRQNANAELWPSKDQDAGEEQQKCRDGEYWRPPKLPPIFLDDGQNASSRGAYQRARADNSSDGSSNNPAEVFVVRQ